MTMGYNEESAQTLRIKLPAEFIEPAEPTPKTRRAKIAALPLEGVRAKLGASEFTLYREFMQSIYDAALITDWQGNIIDGNTRAADFFRCSIKELRAMTMADLIHGFDDAIMDRVCSNLDNDQYTLIEEAYGRRSDHSLFPAEIAINKLHLGDEKHIAFFVRDITRRKRDEELLHQTRDQLAKAERLEMAGSIAGHIAHDFNNLLTPLLAYPDFIRAELPEGSQACEDLDIIARTAQQIADINQQLLALSRRAYHEQAVLNMNEVIESEVTLLARNISASGIKLEIKLAEDLRNTKGSSQQLLRVIQNLCQNALDAMGASGTLTIRTENMSLNAPYKNFEHIPAGEYIKISVNDTGPGIPAKIRDKIFDPFFTTKKADRQRGSGLGLSVVRGIVKDHDGFIDLESAPGTGTTFILYFPICHETIQVMTEEPITGGRETIMVVDDDALQIEVLTRLLQKIGYTVCSARSGEEALRIFRSGRPPDLVLLDMVMGSGMDGTETYQQMKILNPKQKAIIVSGYAESPRVNQAHNLGAAIYLRKPVTFEKLCKAVREELNRR
jgi:PAS domain S-box-containing protein